MTVEVFDANRVKRVVSTLDDLIREDRERWDPTFPWPRYSAGFTDLTPATTPTDFLILRGTNYTHNLVLRRMVISGIADTAATVDVLLQKSQTGGGGTTTNLYTGKMDVRDHSQDGLAVVYTANRTSGGNGISVDRPILGHSKLTFATSTTPGAPAVFEFEGAKAPCIRDLTQEYIVANLLGQSMPAGAKLSGYLIWEEPSVARCAMVGDSVTSNATQMFAELARAGRLNAITSIDNNGSNGSRFEDYIGGINGVVYSQASVLARAPHVLVQNYGINSARLGANDTEDLAALIDGTIESTLDALADCKLILWGPNSLTTDDFGAHGYVTTTGIFTGMTVAQAAQAATDIMYDAYESFRNDDRIFALVQKQDLFGRTCTTVANNPLMKDQLHPNDRGEVLSARQIKPYLDRAIAAGRAILY